ncbi:MAG: histidine kinase N-terminal 7TM domain-containing protein, partial [Candidatus Firestonebacteria bacterium]
MGDILLVLAVITNLALALTLYIKGKSRIANLSFAIVVFFLALWTLTILLYETSNDLGNIILYTKLANISAILILPFFLHFSFVFPFSNKKGSRYLIISVIAAIPTIAIVYFLLFTNLHIKDISLNLDGYKNIIYGPAYYLYTAYFVLLLLWTFANIIIKHKKATGVNKIQIKYVLFATILVAIFGSILNLVLPRFGVSEFSWLGPQFTLIMAGIISYAIIKHRLLDIVVIIRKVTILFILLAIVLGIFSLVAFGLPFVFAESLPEDTFQITLVAVAFIVALFFQPLRRAIEEFTDKWFFKGAYKPQEVIDALSEK